LHHLAQKQAGGLGFFFFPSIIWGLLNAIAWQLVYHKQTNKTQESCQCSVCLKYFVFHVCFLNTWGLEQKLSAWWALSRAKPPPAGPLTRLPSMVLYGG
jgi:hypothetical protein